MTKYNRVLVVCPGGAVTGGPEAMHYLVHVLRGIGVNALIVYLPYDRQFEVPAAYSEFSVKVANYEDVEGDLIIFPEVVPDLVLSVRHADVAIWWLSLDNFLERRHLNVVRDKFRYFKKVVKGQRPWNGVRALKDVIHFTQSHYVETYLKNHGVRSYPLYEPINPKFCNSELSVGTNQRSNEILFNPVKGKKVVDQLQKAYPAFKFTPLKGFTRDELTAKLQTAKIYIDFGHHPGRDRIPREAAIHGCCVVTGLLGSAADPIDLPINAIYKIDQSSNKFIDNFGGLVKDIFENFQMHSNNFLEYRTLIEQEPNRFMSQLKEYFH